MVPRLDPAVWDRKEAYKAELLDRLLASKTARKGVRYYSLAIESHADGAPHLDLLLVFQKRVAMRPTELDFLCEKHGDLTRYRTLNHAILAYGSKEDTPLGNLGLADRVLQQVAVKRDAYVFLQPFMKEDPFRFDLLEFVTERGLMRHIRGWSSVKTRIKDAQRGEACWALKKKPGLRLITPQLIEQRLTSQERKVFDSWEGYCKIVNYINQIHYFGGNRPFKSKQLFLVGPPNTGKTSLNRAIARSVATYQMGVSRWWPQYRDGVYSFFSWNQFRLGVMEYPNLLKLLDGTPMNLQKKGDHAPRGDNQLIIMNSNLSYRSHLRKKFRSWDDEMALKAALKNFPARVEQLMIPEGVTLFLLQKLLVPLDQ